LVDESRPDDAGWQLHFRKDAVVVGDKGKEEELVLRSDALRADDGRAISGGDAREEEDVAARWWVGLPLGALRAV
jgi:hypothetical protein